MRVYRCNPRCYNAVSSECRCQCNGQNHGVGEIQARANCSKLGIPLRTVVSRRVRIPKGRGGKTPIEQAWLFPGGQYWAINEPEPCPG